MILVISTNTTNVKLQLKQQQMEIRRGQDTTTRHKADHKLLLSVLPGIMDDTATATVVIPWQPQG